MTGSPAYCQGRATQVDHLIPRNAARRRHTADQARELAKYKVPACMPCNIAKGPLLRVPRSHAHLIPELEALTGNVYGVFDGKLKSLRAVVK